MIDCAGERVVVEAPTDAKGEAGDAIGLFFAPLRVHLFEGSSGRRLLALDSMRAA